MPEPPDAPAIRVVIVDDHPLLREGTRALLDGSAGIAVVGLTGEGRAAFGLVERLRPDVLLLDIHLPDLSGIEVTRQVRAAFPAVAILVVTGYDAAGYARALLRLGVRGFLSKAAPGDQLVAAVRAVAQGQTALGSAAAQAALGGTAALTAREHEVLRLLAAGRRNKEIAAALSVSENTVEFHLSRIFQKLDVRSRTDAIRKGREQGLVPPEAPDTTG